MTNVEKVKAGELAIENDNAEALTKCLKQIFKNVSDKIGNYKYYFADEESRYGYSMTDNKRFSTIPATELLKEIEAQHPVFSPKRGDYVMVSDDGISWEKYIYLATIEGANYPVQVVSLDDEIIFSKGEKFAIHKFSQMKPLERTTLTKAQIADKFNLDINEFDIV